MTDAALNPYKAAQSYGPLDGDLFFGRDAEGAALARFLIGRPVSVLTAPSGIGKTSLLQAKVLPLLEQEHWHTVLARPGESAIESLIAAFAEHLLPDPAVEATVVERFAAEAGETRSLRDALDWFFKIPSHERIQRRLYVPSEHKDAGALPMVSRALRGSLDEVDLIEHFEAVVCYATPLDLTPHTTLRELARRLRQSDTQRCWREWRSRFGEAKSLDDLAKTFEQEWAPLRPGLTGAVMVLDQFEEIFTLKNPGTAEALFETAGAFLERSTARRASKPIHLVFSLRKEFFADLVPQLRKFGAIEQLTFFLGAMPLPEARSALTKPAEIIGLGFAPARDREPACVDRILAMALDDGAGGKKPDEPLPEGPRYSPAFISLIGAHLRAKLNERPETPMPLAWSSFQQLIPQLDNVFGSFLEDALAKLESRQLAHTVTRFDALELLDRLVTAGGYRNIIAQDALIDQLPMKRSAADDLLKILDFELKLVRREGRRGAVFVEIMHEKLIAPIRRMLSDSRRQDITRASLAIAHDMLYTLPDDPDPTKDPLPVQFRESLLTHLDRLDLDSLAAGNLMRSLLVAGPGGDKAGPAGQGAWINAIRLLSADLGKPASSENRALFFTTNLDSALDTLDGNQLRQVASTALASRAKTIDGTIRLIFRKLSALEASK